MLAQVIIVAHRSDQWIEPCVSSLARDAAIPLSVSVVDNTGNSRLQEIEWGGLKHEIIVSALLLGFSEANNLALAQLGETADYVAFLNQDTRSRADWLGACIDGLEHRPEVAAVTPMIRTYDWAGWDPYFLECARKSTEFARDFRSNDPLQTFYATPVIPAAAMVVRRTVLEEVGPFDPIYGSYYEDYDLCHRIRQAGYQVGVCTGGTIAHFSGSATSDGDAERRRSRWVTRNRVILNMRRDDDRRLATLWRYLARDFPRNFARSLLRRPGAKPSGPFLLAHWDLFRLLPRLVSGCRDRKIWQDYLAEIGWPPSRRADSP